MGNFQTEYKMDQLPEFLNYKLFLANHQNTTQFNFSAEDILQDFENKLLTINEFTTVVLLALYAPIFVIGLFGNLLIIVSVSADRARKAKLYFLVNLALADLAVTVLCMPTSIGTVVYKLWVYGRFLCKFTAFIQGVAVAVSIFSMTAMAVDRYASLQHPMTANRISTPGQSFILILCMWLVAGLFMGPLLYIRDVDVLANVPFLPAMPFCIEQWPQDRDRQAYGVFLLFVVFIIPAFTIAICYAHVGLTLFSSDLRHTRVASDGSASRMASRKRAARMVVILICVFMVCWLPYNVMSALADITENVHVVKALPFVLWLGQAHSAINPMLYWSLNRRFRDSIHRMVKVVKISGCTASTTQAVSL